VIDRSKLVFVPGFYQLDFSNSVPNSSASPRRNDRYPRRPSHRPGITNPLHVVLSDNQMIDLKNRANLHQDDTMSHIAVSERTWMPHKVD
jgi:hypothetical protein